MARSRRTRHGGRSLLLAVAVGLSGCSSSVIDATAPPLSGSLSSPIDTTSTAGSTVRSGLDPAAYRVHWELLSVIEHGRATGVSSYFPVSFEVNGSYLATDDSGGDTLYHYDATAGRFSVRNPAAQMAHGGWGGPNGTGPGPAAVDTVVRPGATVSYSVTGGRLHLTRVGVELVFRNAGGPFLTQYWPQLR